MPRRNVPIYSITDHICARCGTRILRQEGSYVSCGGNAIYHCADCGATGGDLSEGGGICWCSYHMKHHHGGLSVYQCVPMSLIDEFAGKPEIQQMIRHAFHACGCNTDGRAKVGIMLRRDYCKLLDETRK